MVPLPVCPDPPHAYLRAWRKFAGLTLDDVARHLGISLETVSRYETGQFRLRVDYVFAFARLCGCPEPTDPIRRPPDGWTVAPSRPKSTNSLRHIRRHVFGMNQVEFAGIAGVNQSSISRWERGTPPSLRELDAIRRAAYDRGIEWQDQWFFQEPEQ